jgi:hypothetical protein
MTVGGFDLILDKGLRVVQPKGNDCSSLLGSGNQRQKVVRHLARKFLKGREKVSSRGDEEEKVGRKKEKVEGFGR